MTVTVFLALLLLIPSTPCGLRVCIPHFALDLVTASMRHVLLDLDVSAPSGPLLSDGRCGSMCCGLADIRTPLHKKEIHHKQKSVVSVHLVHLRTNVGTALSGSDFSQIKRPVPPSHFSTGPACTLPLSRRQTTCLLSPPRESFTDPRDASFQE